MVKLSMKHAVAVAMLAGASAGANADTIELGEVTTTPKTFNGVVSGADNTGINDMVTLEINDSREIGSSYSITNLPLNQGAWDLEFASVTLWSMGDNGTVGGGDDVQLATAIVSPDNPDLRTLDYDQPLPGPAYLHIAGVTTGTEGGIYSGAAVAVVPEPESFAMLLAGLGLMGAVVRRRSSNKAS